MLVLVQDVDHYHSAIGKFFPICKLGMLNCEASSLSFRFWSCKVNPSQVKKLSYKPCGLVEFCPTFEPNAHKNFVITTKEEKPLCFRLKVFFVLGAFCSVFYDTEKKRFELISEMPCLKKFCITML